MKLKEALEKGKGKVRRKPWSNEFYIHIDKDSPFNIFSANCFPYWDAIFMDDWLPYTEPEKCEACHRLADFIKRAGEGPEENDIAWLIKQNCTCKEGKG